ncbi:MAG: hypothetical protein AAF335_01770, partial [Bacteroidota bacterium]
DLINFFDKYVIQDPFDYRRASLTSLPQCPVGQGYHLTFDTKEETLFFTKGETLYMYNIKEKLLRFVISQNIFLRYPIRALVALPREKVSFITEGAGLFRGSNKGIEKYKIEQGSICANHLSRLQDHLLLFAEKQYIGTIKLLTDNSGNHAMISQKWSTNSGKIQFLATGKEGDIFSLHANNVIKLWNLEKFNTTQRLPHLKVPDKARIHCMASHPLVPMIALAGKGSFIYFWDRRGTQTKEVITIPKHLINSSHVTQLDFSPSGRHLIATVNHIHPLGSFERNMMIWDMKYLKKPLRKTSLNLSSFTVHSDGKIWFSDREGLKTLG